MFLYRSIQQPKLTVFHVSFQNYILLAITQSITGKSLHYIHSLKKNYVKMSYYSIDLFNIDQYGNNSRVWLRGSARWWFHSKEKSISLRFDRYSSIVNVDPGSFNYEVERSVKERIPTTEKSRKNRAGPDADLLMIIRLLSAINRRQV